MFLIGKFLLSFWFDTSFLFKFLFFSVFVLSIDLYYVISCHLPYAFASLAFNPIYTYRYLVIKKHQQNTKDILFITLWGVKIWHTQNKIKEFLLIFCSSFVLILAKRTLLDRLKIFLMDKTWKNQENWSSWLISA